MTENKPEARFLAVIAHLSALGLGMGLVIPAALWAQQRGKSKYLAFQFLQAYGYQSLGYSIWLIGALLIFVVLLFAMPFALATAELGASGQRLVILVVGLLLLPELVLFAVYIILPVAGALACGQGKEFRYPILGRRLETYLGYSAGSDDSPLNETNEERWAAAMGHFAVIVTLWGILAPLIVWASPARRSVFLAVQSAQSVVLQIACTVVFFASAAGILLVMLPIFPLALRQDAPLIPWLGVSFIVSAFLGMFVILVVPLLQILGQWAGLQILRGREYRIPWIGRRLEKWILARSEKGSH